MPTAMTQRREGSIWRAGTGLAVSRSLLPPVTPRTPSTPGLGCVLLDRLVQQQRSPVFADGPPAIVLIAQDPAADPGQRFRHLHGQHDPHVVELRPAQL